MKQIETWYKEYEKEVVFNRAIPNVMDGFKPVMRKIFYTAILKGIDSKKINTNAFSGSVKERSNYHHGDMSITSAVINKAQSFKNIIPIFNPIGSFGTRLDQEASAPRYTDIRLNKDYIKYLIFPEILNYTKQDDNNCYEPDYYLFSIPMVLVNGSSGIGVGLKTDILSYNVNDITKNIKTYLLGKTLKEMKPILPQFTGKITKNEEGNWEQIGIVKKVDLHHYHITEIPTSYDRDKYIKVLQKLKDSKVISNYEDNSTENIDFNVSVTKAQASKIKYPERSFKLIKSIKEEINLLDRTGTKIKKYDNANGVIRDFVDEMLLETGKFIEYKIEEISNIITKNKAKIEFIKEILKLDVRKFTSDELKKRLLKELSEVKDIELFIDDFLRMSILSLTKENMNRYKDIIKNKKEELKYYKSTNKVKLYTKMVEEL